MSFQVDLYSAAWAHIALCADLTWNTESPDDFIIANQRLWAQHCRVSQVLQETTLESQNLRINQSESDIKRPVQCQIQENCNTGGRRVRDVIPESRLSQYGNFYYDEFREKSYTNENERAIVHGCNGPGCENSDLTECWMLPEAVGCDWLCANGLCVRAFAQGSQSQLRKAPIELRCTFYMKWPLPTTKRHLTLLWCVQVEFWFRKLLDDSDRSMMSRRRRHYRAIPDGDLYINGYVSAASERWSPNRAQDEGAEALLAAKVQSVKALWNPLSVRPSPVQPRFPSPPQVSRKIRARRRQPRRLTALAPPPPAYCLEVPAQLFCDPFCKFQFESPRPHQSTDCHRAMGHLSSNIQAAMRASVLRCPPYRGTNVSRYAPTGQRPSRYPDRSNGTSWPRDHHSPRLNHKFQLVANHTTPPNVETQDIKNQERLEEKQNNSDKQNTAQDEKVENPVTEKMESPTDKILDDNQLPSTSEAAVDTGSRKKRLYSAVLSMSAPSPMLAPVVRWAQKLATPGILKLNPKIVLPRMRPPNIENRFEELEKEALEQYKASDESIDTTFQELEKQAVEQYSNSNTSCSSDNSGKKSTEDGKNKPVDSVVIYSQNFPDLNSKGTSVVNLKNFQTPLRGDKKDRSKGSRSDTDKEVRDSNCKNHKGSMRWTLHVIPPKKRHLTLSASDFSSDEETEDGGSIKDAGPRFKNRGGKIKLSAHGGGDLHPIMRKT